MDSNSTNVINVWWIQIERKRLHCNCYVTLNFGTGIPSKGWRWRSVSWGAATLGTVKSKNDLKLAEQLYRSIVVVPNSNTTTSSQETTTQEEASSTTKRRRLDATTDAACSAAVVATADSCATTMTTTMGAETYKTLAKEKLAMLLLQSGRVKEADGLLKELGYSCRLASHVLNYNNNRLCQPPALPLSSSPSPGDGPAQAAQKNNNTDTTPCRIFDNFLNARELDILRRVFADPQSSYWTDHEYAVEPPSPYVSYAIPLPPPTTLDDDDSDEEGDENGIEDDDDDKD